MRPLKELAPDPADVLLVHYSAYAPKLRGLLDLPNPTLLLSHNVTPARWFWDFEPTVAIHCALGRRQLPEFAARADAVAGVSAYNAARARLGDRHPDPLRRRADRHARAGAAADGPPTLLFVGRLAPHKRQDELIRVLALLRRHRLPDARLVLVGEPLNHHYLAAPAGPRDRARPGRGDVRERAVGRPSSPTASARAHAFVSLSEHEGFCIPLLEAFHMGVPVVARPAGGVPEVAGDAALLTDERDPAVLAELVGAGGRGRRAAGRADRPRPRRGCPPTRRRDRAGDARRRSATRLAAQIVSTVWTIAPRAAVGARHVRVAGGRARTTRRATAGRPAPRAAAACRGGRRARSRP